METAPDLARRLIDAPEDAEAWKSFKRLDDAESRRIIHELKAEVDRIARNEPPAALAAAEVLVRAAEDVPDLLPIALRGRAIARSFNELQDEARADLEAALAIYEEHGEELEAAVVRRTLVPVLQYLGRMDEALVCADLARPVFERRGERRLAAQLEVNVANVHIRNDEYPLARRHLLASRQAFKELDDRLGLTLADFNLAVVEMNANDLDATEAHFRSAREGFEAAGQMLHVADCDYNLAYLQSRRGLFADAIHGLDCAAELYREHGKPSGPPLCWMDLAEIYLRLDARRNALEYAHRAVEGFRELGLEYELARSEVLEGLARAKLGDAPKALDLLERAGARFRGLGNEASAAALQVQVGAIEVSKGEYGRAIERLSAAREELKARELRFLTDLAGVTLARAHLGAGEPALAILLLEGLLCDPGGRAVFDILLKTDALSSLADARRNQGEHEAAREALQEAVLATDRNYAEIPSSDIRMAFFRERHIAYVDLAWDLAERGDPKSRMEALLVLERSRARSLRERKVDGEESEEFRRARRNLDWLLTRQLDAEFGPTGGGHELRRSAFDDKAIRTAQSEVKRLAATPELDATPGWLCFDEEDFQRARGSEDVLCVYLLSPRGARVFLIDEHGVSDVPLPATEDVLAMLRDRLWLHVDKLRLGKEYLQRHRSRLERSVDAVLAELGRLLLEPAIDRIGNRPLVIIPYGVLHDLPFHAFLVDGKPLIVTNEVSYGISAWSVARARDRRHATDGELLACGVTSANGHATLAHINEEIETLERLYPKRLRRVAPSDLVDELEGRKASGGLLHIAAHSIYQPREPVFSAVCLGDRFLFAHDLLRMGLDFDLVVLSGCETGRKRRIPGEELFGLSRAIVGAGARATLGSLWSVDDADALAFMSAFYEELSQGQGCRTAVALAQRELYDRQLHPYSWASFILVGAPEARFPATPSDHAAVTREVTS
ncbi:MAG: CHAT domain-containing protein [Planctomycetota bacterium]|nr:CHAT domain-containing protein [Planctomycetota bacterium]